MDAIVTAGGIPGPDDPLYPHTQGKPKALLEVAGLPLIQWIFNALSGANKVDHVVVVGLDQEEGDGLVCDKSLTYTPNQGGMLQNLCAATLKLLEINPEANHVLTISSDIPAITPEMVDWAIVTAE